MEATETILPRFKVYEMTFRNYKLKRSVCGSKDPKTDGLRKGTGTQKIFTVELTKGISGISLQG